MHLNLLFIFNYLQINKLRILKTLNKQKQYVPKIHKVICKIKIHIIYVNL